MTQHDQNADDMVRILRQSYAAAPDGAFAAALLDRLDGEIPAPRRLPRRYLALAAGIAIVCHDSTPDDGTPGSPDCDGLGDAFTVKIFWSEKGTQTMFASSFRP